MKKRINKRAVFFSTDALIAMIIIFLSVLIIYPVIKYSHQDNYLQQDIISSFSALKIGEINNSYVKQLIADGLISDLNNTVLEQIGEFYIENLTIAENLAQIIFINLDTNKNIGLWYGNKLLASKNSSSFESAKNIEVERQFISGINGDNINNESVTGFSARAYLSGNIPKEYFYFGGYIGEGNISIKINATEEIEDIKLEIATNNDFDFYINNNFSGHYQNSSTQFTPAQYDISSYTNNFKIGENTIKFVAEELFIAGGYLKIIYKNSKGYKKPNEYYFPGIEGIINLYDGFYIPGTLNSMDVFLHYNSNYTVFLNIGNITVFNKSSSGESTEIINNVELNSKLDYNYLSNKTIPIRLGLEEISGTFGGGIVDIAFLIDSTGSMYDEINDVYEIIGDFVDVLENSSVDYRLALIEFKDHKEYPCGSSWCDYLSTSPIQLCCANLGGDTYIGCYYNQLNCEICGGIWTGSYCDYWSENPILDCCSNLGDGDPWAGCMEKTNCESCNAFFYSDFPYLVYNFSTGDFTTNVSEYKNKVNIIEATGGMDGPESHLTAINQSLFLDWRSGAKKFDILVTDAPPHALDCAYTAGGYPDNTDENCNAGPKYVQDMIGELVNNDITFFYINKEGDYSWDKGLCDNRIMADNMTNVTGGKFYNYTETEGIEGIILTIAGNIINITYGTQKAITEGDIFSILYPDSYIKFDYSEEEEPYGLIIANEKLFDNAYNGSFNIPKNSTIFETNVISYSGPRWTDNVEINGNNVYSLSSYKSDYIELGDPYVINIPNSFIQMNNTVTLTTGLNPLNSTQGSLSNKIIYKVIRIMISYSPISSYASGCKWYLEFEDGSNLTTNIPRNYTGSEICFYPDNQGYTHNENDAIQTAVYNLLRLLDFDLNELLDVKFTEQDFEISASQITGIPYEESTEVQVRKWD